MRYNGHNGKVTQQTCDSNANNQKWGFLIRNQWPTETIGRKEYFIYSSVNTHHVLDVEGMIQKMEEKLKHTQFIGVKINNLL